MKPFGLIADHQPQCNQIHSQNFNTPYRSSGAGHKYTDAYIPANGGLLTLNNTLTIVYTPATCMQHFK